jgi:hypothetical protein
MLTKHEVATLESLIRRMSPEERCGFDVWQDNFFDENSDIQPNDRPLWQEIEEAKEDAARLVEIEKGGTVAE